MFPCCSISEAWSGCGIEHELLPDVTSHLCRELEKRESETPAERDLWTQAEKQQGWVDDRVVASRPKSVDVKNRPKIAAVEVDPAGCSYNPDYEQHQEAVAVAVAVENLKLIDRELQPKVRACCL
jgi:Nop53 (60S ribosomal biogenesis)